MRVVVLEFANASSDKGLQALGKGLQSMLTTDLSKVKALSLIEREQLQTILAEQKLGQSGKVSKKTAARIGKLVGASYVLAGTYTVHGAKMRLDARLFAVESGKILLAEQITGERDAFFELEKSLVRKFIKALGVKLEPKERAGITRIHTADFQAFKHFSGAVRDYDARRYDKALEAMRAAMKIDADFGLARVMLGQYERVVAQMRAKVATLDLGKRELTAVARAKSADAYSLVLQKLHNIAGEKGKQSRFRRLAALHFLIGFHAPLNRTNERIYSFNRRLDKLLLRGHVDSLARRYYTEARPLFPDVPMFSTGALPPPSVELVEAHITDWVNALKRGGKRRKSALIANLVRVTQFVKLMDVDRQEAIALHKVALEGLVKLNAPARRRQSALRGLSERYLAVGDVASASGALTRMSASMTNTVQLKRVVSRLEKLGKVAKLLARTDKKASMNELITAGDGRIPTSLRYVTSGRPTKRLLGALTTARRLRPWSSRGGYVYFGDVPGYLIQGRHSLVTGPRRDGLRTDSIRYHRSLRRTGAKDALIVLGRSLRTRLDVSFQVLRQPSGDFWPIHPRRQATGLGDLKLDPGSPEITFVFGLRNAVPTRVRDVSTGESGYPNPTHGYGVRFAGNGKLALVELGKRTLALKPLDSRMQTKVLMRRSGMPFAKSKGRGVTVRIRAIKKGLQVTIGRRSTVFALPRPTMTDGFIGLHFRGVGYGEIRALRAK